MKKLRKAGESVSFFIGGILFDFNFARTFLWAEDKSTSERQTIYFSIYGYEKSYEHDKYTGRAITIIILALKITIGWTK